MRGNASLSVDGGDSFKPKSATSIERILSRNLLRIDENIRKKRSSSLSILGRALKRPGAVLVFKSEREEVTLSIDEEGHASVTKGSTSGPVLTLVGHHDSFLAMFQDERNVGSIPESIDVLLGDQAVPGNDANIILKEATGRLLHILFQ